ncbi:hypothetical protein [Mycobacteroides abscessus]|uniref:hypothetical protein n=1 Tax=Mycobacteroides abscessus TaxID=36809 RepID=UPI0009C94919|nr:hypothetical protein [Mycobacteroides abscessus]SKR60587.1 Uncharacterised protein [Mycobacteroides abscessus subsp. abscessus]SKR81372.1 Uncharacterised protein [Mycobacteroides abscessus subsp. abscessus]SKT29034.1 Uncharacterised protein [Mycobacteroides abscessus subsp. abscessus]
MSPRIAVLVAASAAALVLTSCTHEEPKQPSPVWENKDHSTRRWIPNSAVDLMSPEGTFIRATIESWEAAQSGPGRGMDAIRAGGYPGFDHALNNVRKPESVGGTVRFPNVGVGTLYREIVEFRRDGDKYTAGICTYPSQAAAQQPDGQYISNGSDDLGYGWWLTFGPDPKLAAQQQHSPLSNQRGPARRPVDNVFGTWVILDTNPSATDLPQCNKLAPGTPDNWPKPYVRSAPPPTLPNDPGWPEASRA